MTHYNIVTDIEQAIIMGFSETPYLDYQTNPSVFREDQKINALCHTPYSHVSVPLSKVYFTDIRGSHTTSIMSCVLYSPASSIH